MHIKITASKQISSFAFTAILLLGAIPAFAQRQVRLDPAQQDRPFQGWGTSLCWWAKVAGGYPPAARDRIMDQVFDPVKGLGLNIVRYNIGGGENPAMHFLQYRCDIPGYEPQPGKWDWSADANQRWVLSAAIARGADQLEAFSNSPPWWMTNSGSVSGGQGAKNNLREDMYPAFAQYLTTVVQHFHDAWGITFRDLEPLNEPSGGWKYGNWQEGCHFDRPGQAKLLELTAAELRSRGLATTLSGDDESVIDTAVDTFAFLSDAQRQSLSKFNTHSYGGSWRTAMAVTAELNHKDLWMSEFGNREATGIPLSMKIVTDIKYMKPSAWVNWQVADSVGGWGMFLSPLNNETDCDWKVNEKYYIVAQYSRFIRPGFRMLSIDDRGSLAAFDSKSGRLVIVSTAAKTADELRFDLSAFNSVGAVAAVWRTSATENMETLPAVLITDKKISVKRPAQSVTTLVIDNVAYTGPAGFEFSTTYRIDSPDGMLSTEHGSTEQASSAVLDKTGKSAAQNWGLLETGGGVYVIFNRQGGRVLSTYSADKPVGKTPIKPGVRITDDRNGPTQRWTLIPAGENQFELRNQGTGLFLRHSPNGTVTDSNDGNGPQLIWRIK